MVVFGIGRSSTRSGSVSSVSAPRFAAAYVTTRGVALPRTTAAPVRRPSSSAVSTAWYRGVLSCL